MDQPGDKQPYDMDGPAISVPKLPGEVIVRATADETIDALAAELVLEGLACFRRFGDFHLALSGGSTPQPLYERLMFDPNYRILPWKHTHLWIVDERCVNEDDPKSNFGMIRETIVEHAGIPAAQVHPIPAMESDADYRYEKMLRETLCWREKGQERLDFVLLGMGADGHTASLFPHTETLQERERLVRLNTAPVEPRARVTMTYPIINGARFVAVLAVGKSKAPMIQQLQRGRDSIEELPIKGVRPRKGALKWFLDAEAASAPQ